ncbi:bactofilin family protein [Corallibacter sp.]|uniref:bactofilin family protein n=1 Tax=Corallibacter sp. TaxID=2038084 RepID=UPI003A937820
MFSDNRKSNHNLESISNQNIIAKGTKVTGDLTSDGGFRIDGAIDGTLKTPGKIVVGKTGIVNGTIEGTDAYFEGEFSGKLVLSGTLTLKSTAKIEGEVTVGKLEVDPGATFNVTCSMKGVNQNADKHVSKTKTAV